MRDVIQKMVEAEGEAKRVLDAARTEADRILADARRQAHAMAEQSRQETRDRAARILSDAVQQAEREKQQRLAREIAAAEAETRLDEATFRAAAQAVVRAVAAPARCGSSGASGARH